MGSERVGQRVEGAGWCWRGSPLFRKDLQIDLHVLETSWCETCALLAALTVGHSMAACWESSRSFCPSDSLSWVVSKGAVVLPVGSRAANH